jgi:hypothetical protein
MYLSVGLALIAAFCVEFIVFPLRRPWGQIEDQAAVSVRPAELILVVGMAAVLAASYLGGGSYAVQIGQDSASPFAALLTPLEPWLLIGSAYLISARRQSVITGRRLAFWLLLAGAAELVAAVHRAITQPFLSYVVVAMAVALLVGSIRVRAAVIVSVVLVLAFPIVAQLRDQTRAELSGVQLQSETEFSASERLREDIYLSRAEHFQPGGSYGQQAIVEMLRYGFVPSILDRHRPGLASGVILNKAIGGSPISSATFTTVGSILVFVGWKGLVFYFGSAALLVFALTRRLTPHTVVLLMLALNSLLIIERTYPDSIAAFLQDLVAALPAMWLVAHFDRLHIGRNHVPERLLRRNSDSGAVPWRLSERRK